MSDAREGVNAVQPREGYQYERMTRCRGCDAWIAWWLTPAGKQSPHDLDGTSHFATCPKAKDFKR